MSPIVKLVHTKNAELVAVAAINASCLVEDGVPAPLDVVIELLYGAGLGGGFVSRADAEADEHFVYRPHGSKVGDGGLVNGDAVSGENCCGRSWMEMAQDVFGRCFGDVSPNVRMLGNVVDVWHDDRVEAMGVQSRSDLVGQLWLFSVGGEWVANEDGRSHGVSILSIRSGNPLAGTPRRRGRFLISRPWHLQLCLCEYSHAEVRVIFRRAWAGSRPARAAEVAALASTSEY
jgi:hypothetical protein